MSIQTNSTECPICAAENTGQRGIDDSKRVCRDCGMIFSRGGIGEMIIGPVPEVYPPD
jgi:transposase-like protein